MARQYSIDDSEWDEVLFINGYAMFMGYLMMGVRGLGVLIVTWTTVVLLGGFVSVLGKDFRCLTGIMLVQTAGVFNFLLKEKISDFVHSWWGLLAAVFAMVITPFRKDKRGISTKRAVLAVVLSVIEVLVLAIILCPIAVLYVFGLYLSAGVSLWRLIEHDFGNADGGTNLEPALEALYILAVAQGVFFGYKTIHAFGAKIGLAELVVDEGSLLVDKKLVSDYLKDTVAGCEKDPSFANGKNFVTYAVDLIMEAKSNDGFIAGVRILGAVIKKDKAQDQRDDTAPIPDLEKGGVPQDHGQEKASSSHQQNRDNKLRKALVSLCYCWSKSVCYNEYFKHIASKICSEQGKTYESFNSLLEEEYSNIKKDT